MTTQTLEQLVEKGSAEATPKSFTEHVSEACLPITVFTLAFTACFVYRAFSGTFFQAKSERPTRMSVASVLENTGSMNNQFVVLSDFELDDRQHVRKYKKGTHKNSKTLVDICIPMKPIRRLENEEQTANCVLLHTMHLVSPGGPMIEREHAERLALVKTIRREKLLIGTLYETKQLHKSVVQEFPELKTGKTIVFDYAKTQRNYFLLDSFLAVVCAVGFVGTCFCWTWWSWFSDETFPSSTI